VPKIFVQEFPLQTPPETSIRNTSGFGNVSYSELADMGIYPAFNRPIFVRWHGDILLAGAYTRILVRHQTDRRWLVAAIRPPANQLSVVPGSGSGGSSGGCLAFITFLHKEGDRVLAESDRSNVVNVGTLAGEGRDWSGIQAVGAEFRVTHVRGYVSMVGGPYRMAWEAPYGVTTISENVPTARLSISAPASGRNEVPPPGIKYMHAFANRMWYANNPEFPYRLWFSPPGAPQYTSRGNFRDTQDREEITGIWRGRNELLVFCLRSCYLVRQFGAGANDFMMEKLDSEVGCLTHHGIDEIHNRVWFPSEDGVWIYDGGFHYLMGDMRPLWQADYKANKQAFVEGFAVHDRINKVYLFYTNRAARPEWENTGLNPGTVAYVGYYGNFEPSMAGQQGQPDWTLDMLDRFVSSASYDNNGELQLASCDGKIRKQDATDGDDDGDTLQKALIIRHPHFLMFQPGDDIQSGKKLLQLWLHLESELTGWRINAMGGDEATWQAIRPDNVRHFWKYDVPASALAEQRTVGGTLYDYTFTAKSVHYFIPEKVAGRGFLFEVTATAPIGLEYRGLGGQWGPGGAAYRPPQTITVAP
jgi:hypothetical protein